MRSGWIFLILAGCLTGWLWPDLLEAPQTARVARSEAWVPPDLPRRPDLGAKALAISASPIFEPEATAQAAVAAAGPPIDNRWRVAGVIGRGEARQALISFRAGNQPDQRLSVGQRLPSGHRIVSIGDADVCVEVGSGRFLLGVEYRD